MDIWQTKELSRKFSFNVGCTYSSDTVYCWTWTSFLLIFISVIPCVSGHQHHFCSQSNWLQMTDSKCPITNMWSSVAWQVHKHWAANFYKQAVHKLANSSLFLLHLFQFHKESFTGNFYTIVEHPVDNKNKSRALEHRTVLFLLQFNEFFLMFLT